VFPSESHEPLQVIAAPRNVGRLLFDLSHDARGCITRSERGKRLAYVFICRARHMRCTDPDRIIPGKWSMQTQPSEHHVGSHRVIGGNGVVPHHDAVRTAWTRYRLAHGAKPIVGAMIVGGAALALAAEIGALELAIGALAGYTTYRMLRYGIDLKDALAQTIEIEEEAKEVCEPVL
jgi:hypothetical protein